MTHPDLSAFIPTNERDAKKVGWGRMPFDKICERLHQKTSGRVLRADDGWVREAGEATYDALTSGSIGSLQHEKGLWVEVGVA
ncbi:MAG: hypothetical protein WD942_08075, partial [Dehalococcoidia bacterium]